MACKTALPDLRWGKGEQKLPQNFVEKWGYERARRLGSIGANGGGGNSHKRSQTPDEFRDLLISMARSVKD